MWNQQALFTICLFLILKVNCVWSQSGSRQLGEIDSRTKQNQTPSYFFYHRPEYPRDCQEVLAECSSSVASGVYVIKPDGYPEPFEVYCDSTLQNIGWTVIQRRIDNAINFNRSWEEYEIGFGFLSHEFWLGSQKLSYLTNQKEYQLRFELLTSNGSFFNVTYDKFRITDGFGSYMLANVGQYNASTLGWSVKTCPTNMKYGNCTCRGTCADPDSCTNSCESGDTESCVCSDGYLKVRGECVPQDRCICFIPGADEEHDIRLEEGTVFVSENCLKKCSCISSKLICDNNYHCSSNAVCEERDNTRQCQCNSGYEGDGVQCTARQPVDCQEIYERGQRNSGVYRIKPTDWTGDPFEVSCNMSDGGGWTVFQRRVDGSVDFYRYWSNYKEGFGSPSHEVWLGNEKLYLMTNQKAYKLRIDLVDRSGSPYYAKYSLFQISNEAEKYKLVGLGSYQGNTGYDAMSSRRNKKFSTRDQDNDGWSSLDCAERHRGGWWFDWNSDCYGSWCSADCRNSENYCVYFPYGSSGYCAGCGRSHLNGHYSGSTRGTNIFWYGLHGYDCEIKYTEMKIKPVST